MSCQIKVCGLTSAAEAELVLAAGVDALGINLWPGSKRYVPFEECAWLESLAGRTSRVAVLVNPTPEEVARIWGSGRFDWLQLHGEESPEQVAALAAGGRRILKALRVRGERELEAATRYLDDGYAVLLDAFHPSGLGGTGRSWDWGLAAAFSHRQKGRPWILSGGLRAENVSDACRIVQPPAVDVASGVERTDNPRHKDPASLRRFVAAVRGASRESDTNPKIF